MALSVKVDLAAYPPGAKLGIVGIGVVENGGDAVEVTPEGESAFFSVNGNTIESVVKDQEGIDVSGSGEFEPPEGWEAKDPYGVPLSESTYEAPTEEETPPASPPSEPSQPESGLPQGTGDGGEV